MQRGQIPRESGLHSKTSVCRYKLDIICINVSLPCIIAIMRLFKCHYDNLDYSGVIMINTTIIKVAALLQRGQISRDDFTNKGVKVCM